MRSNPGKTAHLSFKHQIKNDLCALPIESEGCQRAELAGLLMPNAKLIVDGDMNPWQLLFRTDSQTVAEWTVENTEKLFGCRPNVTEKPETSLKNSKYWELSFQTDLEKMLKDLRLLKRGSDGMLMTPAGIPPYFKMRQLYVKAFLRGLFLSGGAIADPAKVYRLELSGTKTVLMEEVMAVLSLYGMHLKMTQRHGAPVVWTKEAESVALFLNLIGAHKALLKMEDLRTLKEVRNAVNRRVNCDLANLRKTASASEKQLATIRDIESGKGLDSLPSQLRDLALMRQKYPEVTIQELGEMMDPPIGKSTVFKRFKKMEQLAVNDKL